MGPYRLPHRYMNSVWLSRQSISGMPLAVGVCRKHRRSLSAGRILYRTPVHSLCARSQYVELLQRDIRPNVDNRSASLVVDARWFRRCEWAEDGRLKTLNSKETGQ